MNGTVYFRKRREVTRGSTIELSQQIKLWLNKSQTAPHRKGQIFCRHLPGYS